MNTAVHVSAEVAAFAAFFYYFNNRIKDLDSKLNAFASVVFELSEKLKGVKLDLDKELKEEIEEIERERETNFTKVEDVPDDDSVQNTSE